MSSINVKYDLQLNYNYEDFASAAMGEIGSWRLMRRNVFSSYLDTLIALNISENKLKKHFMHILGFWNKNCLVHDRMALQPLHILGKKVAKWQQPATFSKEGWTM